VRTIVVAGGSMVTARERTENLVNQ
jgi:hypothetical protein